jgi:integrase
MPSHLAPEQIVALLLQARIASEEDFVMLLLTFHHGLRESEVIGQKTTQRGQFQVRAQAEMRLAEVAQLEPDNPAEIREKQIRVKRRRRTVYQVHVKEARLLGGLRPENFSRGYIYVDRLKGSNPVRDKLATESWLGPWGAPEVIERPIVEEFLRAHAESHGGDGRDELLFPMNRKTYWDKMQKYGVAAGIPDHLCHPHILKHSIAKFLLRQMKLTIDIVQGRMGHKSISSTGPYLAADETEVGLEVAKAAVLLAAKGSPPAGPAPPHPWIAPDPLPLQVERPPWTDPEEPTKPGVKR